MANRSYLFAADALPDDHAAGNRTPGLRGIAEYAYDIPLVARILVSADTRLCRSVIWPDAGPIALAGRCGAGIARLDGLLARIDHPSAIALRAEAMAFLAAHAPADGWFVLECGEIFEMGGEPLDEQATQLRRDLSTLDADIDAAVRRLAPVPPTFWQRVFKPAVSAVEAPLRELGLGAWSTTLYHSPEDSSAAPGADD